MRIALIGGTIEALVLAHHLLEKNDVIIIEMEAELGLPVNHPGRVIDPNLLDTYFTSEQQTFLSLQSNSDGWGCRWDWIMKHLAANIARDGVQFLTRTRVLSSTKKNQTIHLELTSTERDKPTILTVDRLVLTESSEKRGPGNRQHSLFPHSPITLSFPDTVPWFGGTVVSEDATSAPWAKPLSFSSRRHDRTLVARPTVVVTQSRLHRAMHASPFRRSRRPLFRQCSFTSA